MMQHLTKPPPPLQASRPELPLELEEVLEKALAKEVTQRYQSAGTLLTAFKAALAQERVRKAEEERVRKAEEERARQAEAERIRQPQLAQQQQQARQERLRQVEEQARKAEAERIRQAQQVRQQKPVQQTPSPQPVLRQPQEPGYRVQEAEYRVNLQKGRMKPSPQPVLRQPQRQPSSLRQSVKHFLDSIPSPIMITVALGGIFIPDVAFLLLGILGFFNVSIIAGFNIDLAHRLVCLAVGLIGCVLTAVGFWKADVDNVSWRPFVAYDLIASLVCLTVGIGGLVDRSFYTSYPLLSLTHVNILDSIIGLVIGVPATLFMILFWLEG